MKYRKRPIVVEAVQLRWDTWGQVCEMLGPEFFAMGGEGVKHPVDGRIALIIPAAYNFNTGPLRVEQDQWVMRGTKGEIYPCDNSIFAETYEPVVLAEETAP